MHMEYIVLVSIACAVRLIVMYCYFKQNTLLYFVQCIFPLPCSDLPGVKVLASTCVIVTNSPQTFHWVGYGFKLTIPQGSLPAGVDQCQLDIMASVAGKYKFPYNLQLVSGVFWVRSHLPGQFQQLLTVEIQHCAKMNSTAKLSFVRARCSQKNLPYTFKQLEGSGSFTDKTSYGLLELNNFSGLAVAGKDVERERVYTASLYYFGSELHSREIHFVVSWNDEIHRTVSDNNYILTNSNLLFYCSM